MLIQVIEGIILCLSLIIIDIIYKIIKTFLKVSLLNQNNSYFLCIN